MAASRLTGNVIRLGALAIVPGSRKCFIGRAPSRRRVEARNARRRAFDKAVRRKPLGFAADAGLCKLNAAHGTGASQVRVVSGGGEEPVANSATGKGSSMVVLGMSICVKQELVRGQGARRRGAAKHAKFSGCG